MVTLPYTRNVRQKKKALAAPRPAAENCGFPWKLCKKLTRLLTKLARARMVTLPYIYTNTPLRAFFGAGRDCIPIVQLCDSTFLQMTRLLQVINKTFDL